MSISASDALAIVSRAYSSPAWLAPALVALAQTEAPGIGEGINAYAVGDKRTSFGAWQVHSIDWPAIADRVQASYTLGELDALTAQAEAIRPIVADALAELATVPSWSDRDRASGLHAVWQLGAPGFRRVLHAASSASWYRPDLEVAAVADLYGGYFGQLVRERADRYLKFMERIAGDALWWGNTAAGGSILIVVILAALALGTERGRRTTWASLRAGATAAKVLL